jgi:hypothetical protein
MKTSYILVTFVAVCIVVVSLTACNKKKNGKNTSEISTDINKLSQLINLPYHPKAVWWQVTRIGTPDTPSSPGPNDWKLNAVLLFEQKDLESILNKSLPELQSESPETIYNSFSEIHGLLKNHGTFENKIYKADLFGQSNGLAIRFKGTDKLFVTFTTR